MKIINFIFKNDLKRLFILILLVFCVQENVLAQDSSALKKQDSLLLLVKSTESDSLKIKYYNFLYRIAFNKDKNKGVTYLTKIRDLYDQKNNRKKVCSYNANIGWYYIVKMEQPEKAKPFLDQSLHQANKLKDTLLIGKALTYAGIMHQRQGYYKTAMNFFLKALPYKESMQEHNRIAFSYNLIGEVYEMQERYDKSLEYHFKALKTRKIPVNNDFHIGHSYQNISVVYYKDKKYDLALDYGLKALKIYKRLKTIHNISNSHVNTGKAYLKLQQADNAIFNFKETLKLDKDLDIHHIKIDALNGLAESFLDKKELDTARYYANKSLKLAEKHEYANVVQNSYYILSEIARVKRDYKKAYEYYTLFIRSKDSIVNAKTLTQISEMESLYSVEKKEKEIASLGIKNVKQLQLTKEKNHQRNIAFIIASILVVLSLLLLFFYKQTNKQKNALEVALNDRNVLLKETHHRIKNSFQMVSSLLFLQSENIEDNKAALAVKDGQNRVKSMALIHQKLYQKDNLVGIETKEYFEELAKDIFLSYKISSNDITLHLSIEDFVLDVDSITPLGLIVNELITNALKHAYGNSIETPYLSISLHKKENYLMLNVKDNGVGFEKETTKKTSFGLKLITSLAKKLGAKIEYTQAKGTEVQLKIYKYKLL